MGGAEATLLVIAALAVVSGGTFWGVTAAVPMFQPDPLQDTPAPAPIPITVKPVTVAALQPDTDSGLERVDRSSDTFRHQLSGARDRLADQLRVEGWRPSQGADATENKPAPAGEETLEARAAPDEVPPEPAPEPAVVEETAPREVVPLPRARPAQANLATMIESSQAYAATPTPKPEEPSMFRKLTSLFPGKLTLTSLSPDTGLFSKDGPDLAALGYDPHTAVYDISAHALYLPSRITIEAHSGLGELMDDPKHVDQRMTGATPPGTYELKPREKPFHGIRALRMIPIAGSNALGRSGLLTHPYMLGPNGDSNGCVSIKNYDRFLKAYDEGEITRLVVVPGTPKAAPVVPIVRASTDS
ncbi:MAG: DUF2778 domain-containing protein [Alphaproteobacteria bacterium]|nr:DUF2778 domain-containing protein [Alphaproteobacteria bacterium]